MDIFEAARTGNVEELKRNLANGVDVNAKDERGNTVLMIGTKFGYIDVVNTLLESGANANLMNYLKETALMYAAMRCDPTIVVALLKNCVDNIDATDFHGDTALITAVRSFNADIVNILIKKGANINVKGEYGKTALIFAVNTTTNIINILIENGADINAKSACGETALMVSAGHGYINIVTTLLANGADINVTDRLGDTALTVAVSRRYNKIVGVISVATAADAFLLDVEIPEFLPEHIELFLARVSNAISKQPNAAQYNRFVAYCTDHDLVLTEELQQKIAESLAKRLFNSIAQEEQSTIDDLNGFDEITLGKIFFAFTAKAKEKGISDYDAVINSLNSSLLPDLLAVNIARLMQDAKQFFIERAEDIKVAKGSGINVLELDDKGYCLATDAPYDEAKAYIASLVTQEQLVLQKPMALLHFRSKDWIFPVQFKPFMDDLSDLVSRQNYDQEVSIDIQSTVYNIINNAVDIAEGRKLERADDAGVEMTGNIDHTDA